MKALITISKPISIELEFEFNNHTSKADVKKMVNSKCEEIPALGKQRKRHITEMLNSFKGNAVFSEIIICDSNNNPVTILFGRKII